jgi:hypothetical protein
VKALIGDLQFAQENPGKVNFSSMVKLFAFNVGLSVPLSGNTQELFSALHTGQSVRKTTLLT